MRRTRFFRVASNLSTALYTRVAENLSSTPLPPCPLAIYHLGHALLISRDAVRSAGVKLALAPCGGASPPIAPYSYFGCCKARPPSKIHNRPRRVWAEGILPNSGCPLVIS